MEYDSVDRQPETPDMSDDEKPIRTPFRQWLSEARERFGPVSVWLCTVAVVLWLIVGRTMQWEITPLEQQNPGPDVMAHTAPENPYPAAPSRPTTGSSIDPEGANPLYVTGIRTHR
jgi:hypothetical protein